MTDVPVTATQPVAGVLVDVDGTLVTKTKALTPRAIEAIEQLHERGVILAITSGRPPRGAGILHRPVPADPWYPATTALLDRVVKIVGVSDDHDRVARYEAAVRQQFGAQVSAARSQPHYVDVTHPEANKGVVAERMSYFYRSR